MVQLSTERTATVARTVLSLGDRLDQEVMSPATGHWMQAIARALSVMVLAGFVFAYTRFGAPGGDDYPVLETTTLIALGLVALSMLLAWRWEGPFGMAVVVGGVFIGSVTAFEYGPFLSLSVAVSFTLPGIIFLLAWDRIRTLRSVIAVLAGTLGLVLLGGAAAYAFHDLGYGPSHPESERQALPESPVTWIWSGGVTEHTATVVAKATDAASVRLAYGTDLDEPSYADSTLRGPVYRFELSGLSAGTSYVYAVEIDGTLDMVRSGSFSTWPDGEFSFTVAFAGCARTGSNGAVFDEITALEPDLFLSTGDFYYGQITSSSLDGFSQLFDQSLSTPAQTALYASVPVAYTWDDHDYGPNDSDANSPTRTAALTTYRTIVPHYELELPGPDAPISQAFTMGQVRFILTDTRSARTPSDAAQPSVLGDEQLSWFLDELAEAAESHALVVWVSSIPWFGAPEPGGDSWAGYNQERETIAAWIDSHDIDNLLMLAGDAHMIAIDDGSNNAYGSFPLMQAGALDRPGSEKGGPYSEGAIPGSGQFGLLSIEDLGSNGVIVDLSGRNWEGSELTSLTLRFPNPGTTP